MLSQAWVISDLLQEYSWNLDQNNLTVLWSMFPSIQGFLKLLTWSHLFHPWLPTTINSLWPSDAIWCNRSGSTLVQVMACCLAAPSHYLNQCWLIINSVNTSSVHLGAIWQEALMNFIPDICFEYYTFGTFKMTTTSPSGQWYKFHIFLSYSLTLPLAHCGLVMHGGPSSSLV